MPDKFTPKAQNALNESMNIASAMGHSYIGSEHLLMGLLCGADCAAAKILNGRKVTYEKVKKTVAEITGVGIPGRVSTLDITPKTRKIIENSAYESAKSGTGYIGTEHLLSSLLSERDCVAVRIIESIGASASELKNDTENYLSQNPTQIRKQTENKPQKGSGQSILNYGRDLTDMANRGKIDPIIGRDKETERVIMILSRRTKNNPCLIGEPGVGKTAVVEGLAQRIVDGRVPESLKGKTIISLDISGMIAGAKYRGEFEERLKNVLYEASRNKDLILFIDEIHTIIGAGAAEGAVDAANIIKPALARGEMRVIGATTITEYRKHIERDAALERRFQPVNVGEPDKAQTVEILKGLRPKYEAHHNVTISDEALQAAVDLSVRYLPDRFLPDKAIDLVDEAASGARIKALSSSPRLCELEEQIARAGMEKSEAIMGQDFEAAARFRDIETDLGRQYSELKQSWDNTSDRHRPTLTASDIADVVRQQTDIPMNKLMESDSERLQTLSDVLKARVIDQDLAADTIARAIKRGRIGLQSQDRPIGSFIFAGPTGVGKTEMAKALCEALFGESDSLIRFDMSEYMEKASVAKLIGSPPGYVGYEEGGLLTEKIRRKPYCVVLFDEIEKAHPDVFNILLQLLDDGILTDSQGHRANFRNAIIIMTTNLGAFLPGRISSLGFTAADKSEEDKDRTLDVIKKSFRPEFLNRIDAIIVFNALGDESLRKITALLLRDLKERIYNIGIRIDFDDSVTDLILSRGKEDGFGARPLKRCITSQIEDAFSEEVLEGRIKGGECVLCRAEDGRAVFEKLQNE